MKKQVNFEGMNKSAERNRDRNFRFFDIRYRYFKFKYRKTFDICM